MSKILSSTLIDNTLWNIKYFLMTHYGTADSERDIAPLAWYVVTGRASREFLHLLVDAKPYMIGRRLHQGGSYDEVIHRIQNFLGYQDSTNT